MYRRWPIAPAFPVIIDYHFYPATSRSVTADLWIKFDPLILTNLSLQMDELKQQGLEKRIGCFPTSLVLSLVSTGKPHTAKLKETPVFEVEDKTHNRFTDVK